MPFGNQDITKWQGLDETYALSAEEVQKFLAAPYGKSESDDEHNRKLLLDGNAVRFIAEMYNRREEDFWFESPGIYVYGRNVRYENGACANGYFKQISNLRRTGLEDGIWFVWECEVQVDYENPVRHFIVTLRSRGSSSVEVPQTMWREVSRKNL